MDKINDAIRDTVDPENKGVMVLRTLALVELIDSTGQRALAKLFDSDLAIWDAIGMLEATAAELRQHYAMMAPSDLHGE